MIKELPPTLDGQPWTVATLKALDPQTMRKIIRLYGAEQINKALSKSRQDSKQCPTKF